jgi:hypothetical protein
MQARAITARRSPRATKRSSRGPRAAALRSAKENIMNRASSALIASLSILAACSDGLDPSEGTHERNPNPGHEEPIPPHDEPTIACAEGYYEVLMPDGTWECGDPAESEELSEDDDYDPGMPDADEVPDLECKVETLPLPTASANATTECVVMKPTLYRSALKLLKFDIRVKGVKVGEHSTTRVYRYKWEWDPAAQKYKEPEEFGKTEHSNHWAKDDGRLRVYAYLETDRTDIKGAGFLAYPATAGQYCPCADSIGHLTEWDSCYVLTVSPLFKHVCHSDTRVQVRAFQLAKNPNANPTLGDRCGQGLHERNAPVP